MTQCCKTCKHFGVEPNAAGKIVVRAYANWPCNAPEPVWPPMSDALIKSIHYRWPPKTRSFVSGHDGENCATYERATKNSHSKQSAIV